MYVAGTSEAGSKLFTSDPRDAFFGVGNAHGESSVYVSSAKRLLLDLLVGFGSSSKREDEGFGPDGGSSSPNRDMATAAARAHARYTGPIEKLQAERAIVLT
jgi:hypothetical protein